MTDPALHTVVETDWPGPDPDTTARAACEGLEAGRILLFRGATPFALPDDDRRFLLSVRQSQSAYHKNISYRPTSDQLRGHDGDGVDGTRLAQVMRDYSRAVTDFAGALLAPYRGQWRQDFASFRPVEEDGRKLRTLARNDLLHVDSFPTRPVHGDRILRIFTNINPTETRRWTTTDGFERLAADRARLAGLDRMARRRLGYGAAARAGRRVLRGLGLRLPERSRYDAFMLAFHDFLKRDADFQASCRKEHLAFAPGATWAVFTDMVPHAVATGRYALEHTFIVSHRAMLRPAQSPLGVLEALCGRRLVA